MCKDSNCWVNEGGQKAKLGGETNNPFLLTIGSTLKGSSGFLLSRNHYFSSSLLGVILN
jgi:hypothetical protein